MKKLQCGLCPAQMTTAAGHVAVAEYHHPHTVKVDKPICLRCQGLIVAAEGEQILRVQTIFAQVVREAVGAR